MPDELQAVRSLPSRVGIRKMHSNVPQSSGSENCVRNRMGEHICIGMAFQSDLGHDMNTAEDQRPAGSNPMIVPSQTGSDIHDQEALRSDISNEWNR